MKYTPSVLTMIYLVLVGCGGGSGGSSSGATQDTLSGSGCDNPYHRAIIGVYDGIVSYRDYCTWDVTLTLKGSPIQDIACEVTIKSSMSHTQNVVYDVADPSAFECKDSNGFYETIDPYSSNTLGQIEYSMELFPVYLTVLSTKYVDHGEFTGIPGSDVAYYWPFDGVSNQIIEEIKVDGSGSLSMISDDTGKVIGTLTKR